MIFFEKKLNLIKLNILSNKKTTEWLINESRMKFNDSLDYSKTIYINALTNIEFRCKKHNFIFFQKSNNHLNSSIPCKKCLIEHKRNLFSDDLDSFKSKMMNLFGDIFSFENCIYLNQRTNVRLTCKIHNIEVINQPQQFLKGIGCKICSQEAIQKSRSENTLLEIKEYLKKINGKCLTTSYINNETNLEFECEKGHKFFESWSDVKNSLRWCPKCSPNKLIGETLARLMLEHLLNIDLPSTYIKDMEGLQLDGYNEQNKIAFEYQGYQHYSKNSHFHDSENQYNSQLQRDQKKKELCIKNNITLIEIYEFDTIRLGRIDILFNQVKEVLINLKIKFNNNPFELDLMELYFGKQSDLYNKAKKIVEDNKGKIQDYIGSNSKHYYFCELGHKVVNRTLGVIINSKANCPICNDKVKFNKLKDVIESKGGILLDTELKRNGYSGNYNWICKNGHNRISKGNILIQGHGCIDCQRQNKLKKIPKSILTKIIKDVESGNYFQKEILINYKISDPIYRKIIKEMEVVPKYKKIDYNNVKKVSKGVLFQLDPISFKIINKYESLESVKYYKNGIYKPEGIRFQMKSNSMAYGYYWCREKDYDSTVLILKSKK
jgi:hypothetical protein